ncbi:MAG: type II toxin-antitoxin system prevent-host-death family antitoxin [Solirubrobacterales bacterium]|mgnify:FL=1|nr:type II toxin-antitoxin system prevent-host-death family antitoxin [Solirubrobacterales bacterium]
MLESVGVRDLRQNLSRFLAEVKEGKSLVVTERGREIARLTPSGPADSPIARLAADRGATLPAADLLSLAAGRRGAATGPPSAQVLAESREERL